MSNEKLEFQLLEDKPISKDDKNFYDFYHKYVSPSLKEILENKSDIQTIGLFGSWGSGKSTIIKNLETECSKTSPVYIFDAWKYQSDPLRRTFLIDFFRYIDRNKFWEKGEELPPTFLDNFYESETKSVAQIISPTTEKSFWKRFASQIKNIISIDPLSTVLFGILIISIIVWVLGQYFLGEKHPIYATLLKIPGILSLSTFGTAVSVIIVKKAIETLTEKLLKNIDLDVKTQAIIRTREFLNSPEQFEEKFNEIIARLSKRVIIVFDNIDRVQGEAAIEALSTIKTFIGPHKNDKVIFIVPCDPDAISKQIQSHYEFQDIESSEYLRKLFNVVLWTPEFIDTDLEDYTKRLIDQLNEPTKIMDDDELILVINHAFKSNPREIKQFLNNLISFLLIASKTEVWGIIKGNIPYMAKVLIIKQKFPLAFLRLKENVFEPENILREEDSKEFRNFMLNTSNTRTNNAEPFIYLKKPNQSSKLVSSEELSASLISGNVEKSKELILKNTNKVEELGEYILSLYSRYKNKPDWMLQIFKTHCEVFISLNLKIQNIAYYNRSLETIDKYIWQNYLQLPIKYLFDNFICNTKTRSILRTSIINRYISELSRKTTIENKTLAKEIIENLIKPNVEIENDSLINLRKYIEEAYSLELSIMELFNSFDLQNKYITVQALDKLVRTINYDNIFKIQPILLLSKQFINEKKLGEICTETINKIFQSDSISSDDSTEKQTLIKFIGNLLKEPFSIASSTELTTFETLGNNIINSYNTLNTEINGKYYFINTLLSIKPHLSEEGTKQIDNILFEFIKTTDITVIERVMNEIDGFISIKDFISQYLEAIKERAISLGGESLGNLYDEASENEKFIIISSVIDNKPDLNFSFIGNLKTLPYRQQVILNFLKRINVIPIEDRKKYYGWISENIKQTDSSDIKNLITAQISELLKSDNSLEEEIGFELFQNIKNIFGSTSRRELAKDIIGWLRTPVKNITRNNWFSLKTISIIFNELQITPKSDFIAILFDLLNKPEEKDSIEMATNIIKEIKPKWGAYETDFIDLKEKIKEWTNIENRNFVISEIKMITSDNPTKKEKKYWEEMEDIRQSVVKETDVQGA